MSRRFPSLTEGSIPLVIDALIDHGLILRIVAASSTLYNNLRADCSTLSKMQLSPERIHATYP